MKQKKLLSLGVIMLLTLAQLFAQKQRPPLTFKSGDWLETDIRICNFYRNSDYNLRVRYEVSDKMSNGNVVFKGTIERLRLKYADAQNNWLSYDSYYPRYLENRKKILPKQTYEMTANGLGKISNLKVLSTAPKFNFSLISVNTTASTPKTNFPSESIFPIVQVREISEAIISALIAGEAMPKTLQLSASRDIANVVFKSASFTLPTNAVIKGHITNLSAVDTIYAVDAKIFRFSRDGSFNSNVLAGLTLRQRWIMGQFDAYKTFTVFLEPFDTLIVKADRLDFDKTLSFSGNAAAKAGLSKELTPIFNSQWVNESMYRNKSLAEFLSFQKKGQKDFDHVINKYANRVSSGIIDENRTNFKFTQAGTKLEFFSYNCTGPKPKMSLGDFPEDYFVSIDTLPVSMSNAEGGLHYIWYMKWLLSYKQTKLGVRNAGQYGFLANYATAMASFNGYPLYFSIYNSLKDELYKSETESTERLKTYYEDFINNCGDTTLTNQVKEQWAKARKWLPGNPGPVKQLFTNDGNTLELAKFKGKPLVIILNYNNPDVLKGYIDLIKKQNGNKVHFLIAQRVSEENTIGQTLKALPNVTYVEIDMEKPLKDFNLYYQQTKVYTFDSDYRVISSYLLDAAPDDQSIIADLIQQAIDSGVMTREQKAELIKTIGWSTGSILFASLIFFWIYKARLANLKRKESLKRQIKELEVKAIRSQMNPHFIFNALNSIQSLINNQQYKEANFYLEKFALLMRRVLNNSEKTFISLADELQAVTLYVELEQLRFDFVFDIHLANGINANLVEIPGMITQPLIENAILHGIAQKGTAGKLKIDISNSGSYLKIVISDNGSGWNGEVKDGHDGFGLKLVRERLNLLNTPATKGNLEINANLAGQPSGVTAVLTIPID
ncbi:sensor histidine kinase [Pedobacter sp. MC2016-24]|uniref:sensor histidine kinase n=1 Tax=Pedobacter sp. MC2016-24 TaxID=2780090 RepID=UPI001882479C|nr:histidine kinase [Pedobacter sp. MC2016-24]MBE9603083.1 histidine kinase [Pedobacter sp. MC2016-24]